MFIFFKFFDQIFTVPPVRFVPDDKFVFPTRPFADGDHQRRRACKRQWFHDYEWLHYVASADHVLCFTCRQAADKKLVCGFQREEAKFTTIGFKNWNDGRRKIRKHEQSDYHQDAVFKLSYKGPDVGDMVSGNTEAGKKRRELGNRMLVIICRVIRYLAIQNIALRGRTYTDEDGECWEPYSNFNRLMKEFAVDNAELRPWLKKKNNLYTAPSVQNELLSLMRKAVQLELASLIKAAGPFSLMMDETRDINNKEQLVLCLRWTDSDFLAHEDFVGLFALENTTAKTMVATVKQAMAEMDIPMDQCTGQCYDGASAMSGKRNGVSAEILKENPKAIYIHCYGHAVNLAIQDAVKGSRLVRDALDIVSEVCKLISTSPKRDAKLASIRLDTDDEEVCMRKIRTFCPTR